MILRFAVPLLGLFAARPNLTFAAGFLDVRRVGTPVPIAALALDPDGFLWTAGVRGLCRFDGADWLCPIESSATALYVSPDANVWGALASGSIVKIGRDRSRFVNVGRVSGSVTGLVYTRGAVWVASDSGVLNIDLEGKSATIIASKSCCIVLTKQASLFAAVGNDLVMIDDNLAARRIARFDAPISALGLAADAGSMIVGTDKGEAFQVEGEVVNRLPLASGLAPIAPILQDLTGGLWFGGEGLHHQGRSEPAAPPFHVVADLPHHRVTALQLDADDGLWVGTPAGLAYIRTRYPLRTFGRAEGLGGVAAFSITSDSAGAVWVVTGSGLAVWRRGYFTSVGPDQGFHGFNVRSVAIDTNKNVWAADAQTGLYLVSNGRATKVWPPPGFPSRGVRAVHPRMAGGVWMGLVDGGLAHYSDGRFTLDFSAQSPGRDVVHDLADNVAGGGLWLALAGDGLALWSKGKLRRVPISSAPTARVVALRTTPDGALWVGTDGAGLLRYHQGAHTSVTSIHGLPDDHVFGIAFDKQNRMWLSSPIGVSVIDSVQLSTALQGTPNAISATTFSMRDGVPGEPMRGYQPSVHISQDGTIWFPTIGGLLNVDPDATSTESSPRLPLPVLDAVDVNGQPLLDSEQPLKPERSFELSFRFAVAFLSSGKELRVRYKLEGLQGHNEKWHESGHARIARYQSVPAGHYKFRVQAFTQMPLHLDQTVALRETVFELMLPAPWFDFWVVRVAALTCLALLLVALHRARLRRFKRIHSLVLAERSRIAGDIHDSLEQDFLGLRLQVDAARLSLDSSVDATRDHLRSAGELIKDGMVDLRNSIWSLRSPSATTAELMTALQARLARLTEGTGIRTDTLCEGAPRVLSSSVAAQVVHITREAVTNALKHAHATHLQITLNSTNEHEVSICIKDNGVGISGTPPSGEQTLLASGTGTATMQARARSIGGSVAAVPGADGGTTVTLCFATKRAISHS